MTPEEAVRFIKQHGTPLLYKHCPLQTGWTVHVAEEGKGRFTASLIQPYLEKTPATWQREADIQVPLDYDGTRLASPDPVIGTALAHALNERMRRVR